MSGLGRDGLRRIAEAATPGPWRWRNGLDVYLFGARNRVAMAFERMGMQGAQPVFRDANDILHPSAKANLYDFPDATHIAAFDPPTVLALLDTADAHDRLVAALRGMRDEWDNEARQAWSDADRINCGDVIADQISRRAERLRALLAEHGEATP